MVGGKHASYTIELQTAVQSSVIDTLKYFGLFHHPLKAGEIHKFIDISISRQQLADELNNMVANGILFRSENMYALENHAEQYCAKRELGAAKAAERLKEAHKSAKIISYFPFVKSVCVSGSLSKGYADEKSDIDFFIVTAHNRLWICRSFLHLFKKFSFLVNKQHSFCMNYFIDETRMCLEEKNRFTATELSTLIPMSNMGMYAQLMDENQEWIKTIFPNIYFENTFSRPTIESKTGVTRFAEWILNGLWPGLVNNWLMNLTDKKWRKKWKKKNYPAEDYDLAMKTKWYVSKQHPLNYQKRVLSARVVNPAVTINS